MTTTELSRKDYLKKYLSGGSDKKKKKKKISHGPSARSKIVDDDLDLKNMKPIDLDDLDILDIGEEAPQIAGIVDERPDELRTQQEYRGTKKWRIVADENGIEEVKVQAVGGREGSQGGEGGESDASPPRKRGEVDSDASPPRKPVKKDAKMRPKAKRDSDSDASPPRRRKNDADNASPPRRRKERDDSDASPSRKNKGKSDSDASPPRRRKRKDSDASPPRKRRGREDSDESPPRIKHRRRRWNETDQSPRKEGRDQSQRRVEKTLEGKKAGLQDARELRKESESFRKKQKDNFAEMTDEVSGRNAQAVMRDRRTGRKRDLKEEARQRKEKEEKEAEKLAKYAVWGKGLKQVEARQAQMSSELHEMSKPLARYADDADLEDHLKRQDREGDPMLEYLQKKRGNKGREGEGRVYQGSAPPNRYGVRPGFRWDGVDRSNGYEKKYFEEQNARKAREEEAFKWSTADM